MEACAWKDARTAGNYRKVVRVAKNARNALIKAGEVARETAPSYFLESLLWNVPDLSFGNGLQNAYQRAIEWLDGQQDELGTMRFPNGRGGLFENTSDTSWNQDSAKQIIAGLRG